MPETRLTAFSSGRVTVDSMVSGETLPELTVTETTGGWKLGSRAIGSRGMANRPSTTMAVAIIATVTRRVTAKSAIDKCRYSPGRAEGQTSVESRTFP